MNTSPSTDQRAPTEDIELDQVSAFVRRIVEREAFGPLREMVFEHLETPGKRFRARLTLSAARALGVESSVALPFAAACELLHNAALIHDDLQDGDEMRRGELALWARHGAEQAINAGDLLLMLPWLALEHGEYTAAQGWNLSRALARRSAACVCGQSLEQAIRDGHPKLWTWAQYERAVLGKTGALVALPVEGAAILAERPCATALGDVAGRLGLLFQIHDDVVDLYGDKGREQLGNDLREGKVSALVVSHLELHPADAADLVEVLRRPREETSDAEVSRLTDGFGYGGALELVAHRSRGELTALQSDPTLLAEPALRQQVLELAEQLVSGIEHWNRSSARARASEATP